MREDQAYCQAVPNLHFFSLAPTSEREVFQHEVMSVRKTGEGAVYRQASTNHNLVRIYAPLYHEFVKNSTINMN